MTAISVDPACCLTEPTKASSPQKICAVSEKSTALLNDSDINNIVERKLRSNNFRVLQWSLDSMGETNGFLGSYYTLAVTVKIGDKSRQLKFFAKTPPPIRSPQYDFLIRSDTLNKEMIVYSEVMPRMGIGSSSKWLPDFYLGKKSIIIVLEDATQEGYIMPDKYIAFDEDHCILAAKTLSSLHSRSLILDEKLRRSTGQTMFDVYGHVLEEVAFMKNDLVGNKYLSSCVVGACTMVDLVKGLKNDEATAIKEWIQSMIPRLPDLLVPSSKFRNVMCHRDVWANNMMFKTDSAGKPIGCYLVDFQFLRYSPPALDFVICFFLTTDRATRRRLYNRLIDVYYDSMSKELSSEGLDVEECLPRSQFVESCHELKEISLTYSIANMQIMLLNKDAVEEYFIGNCEKLEEYMYGNKRADLVLDQCRNARTFQSRITEIIEEIRELLATDTRRR
ncbi:uncharacterized protein LOC108623809 [Ceratina calcarata]|uniref:Uncharacterized protein LOC108623809 n=1 Tax=Ceratina calcarata TaxID=156304 RepID=A0AAJ7IW52_9HYME|nr:uncharacterized protein LOC108623809 [Ceratina calcarata]